MILYHNFLIIFKNTEINPDKMFAIKYNEVYGKSTVNKHNVQFLFCGLV